MNTLLITLFLVVVCAQGKALVGVAPGAAVYYQPYQHYQNLPRLFYYPVGRQQQRCSGLSCALQGIGAGIGGIFQGADTAANGIINGVSSAVIGVSAGVGAAVGGAASGAGQGVGGVAEGTGTAIGGVIEGTGSAIGGAASGAGHAIGDQSQQQRRVCFSGLFYYYC